MVLNSGPLDALNRLAFPPDFSGPQHKVQNWAFYEEQPMYQSLRVRKVSTGSIFKLVFVGLACSLPITFLALSLLSLWGYGHVQVNGQARSWIASPVTGLILAVLLSLFVGALMSLGLWIYARFAVLRLDLELVSNEMSSGAGQSLRL